MKPIRIGTASSGDPAASADDIRIHSSYNPQKEAQRYLDRLNLNPRSGAAILVIGAGLGYLDRLLREKYPESPVLAFHLAPELYDNRIAESEIGSVIRWHPGIATEAEEFLAGNLDEASLPGLKVVEWAASISVRPETARDVSEAITRVVRRLSGNISATAAFGRLWIRNTLHNFTATDEFRIPGPVQLPVVLAASGPSLEEALPLLHRYRSRFRLWALPSSMPALTGTGLIPEIVFSTDPGHWARLHSRYFPPETTVAMPLSAVPPAGNRPVAPLLIRQNGPGEARLLNPGDWPALPLPEMGTVAATGLEAWSRLCQSPLLLVGLDLAWTDLRSHVRPHSFDGWLEGFKCRTKPSLTVDWERASIQAPDRRGRHRNGAALRTYADWFAGRNPGEKVRRFHRTGTDTGQTEIPGLREEGESWFERLPPAKQDGRMIPGEIHKAPLTRKQRLGKAADLICHWTALVESPEDSEEKRQLMYTLDPGGVLDRENDTSEDHNNRVREILAGLERCYG